MPAFRSVAREVMGLHRAQLAGVIEKRGIGRMVKIYEEARAGLQAKLDQLVATNRGDTFQAHHYRLVLAQLHDALRVFGGKFREHLTQTGEFAAMLGNRHLLAEVKKLERAFTGTTPVLQTEQAGVYRRIWSGVEPSLLNRYRQSVDLYGRPTVEAIHDQMALSLASADTVDQAVTRVASTNGVFAKQRWRAERIVRTESSFSYGIVKQRSMEEVHARDMPQLQKRLISTFDSRTSRESYEQHLQTVPVNGEFVWHHLNSKGQRTGQITRYLIPPQVPNDRAVMIPWNPSWPTPAVWEAPAE